MKVLVLSSNDICGNCSYGGAQCSKRNYELMKKYFGYENTFLIVFRKNQKQIVEIDAHTCSFPAIEGSIKAVYAAIRHYKVYMPGLHKEVIRYIERVDADVIFFDNIVFGVLEKSMLNKKIIAFMQNVESDYTYHKVKKKGLQYLPAYWSSQWNEKKVIKFTNRLLALTERDANRINSLYHCRPNFLLPITMTDTKVLKEFTVKKNKELLFIGSFFGPNYDGIYWFVESVMSELPEYSLTIVGKGFEQVKKKLERANVKVVGTVESLDEYYLEYPLLVMPILYGEGMKVKTCEALMHGKAILATDEALEGYNVEGLPMISRCNDAQQFIIKIKELFESIQIWESCYEDIRGRYLEKYSTESVEKEFFDFMDEWLETVIK